MEIIGLTSKFKAFRGHPAVGGANVSSAKVPTATQFFLGFSWHSDGYKKSQNRRRRRQQQKCKRGTEFDFDSSDDRKLSCPSWEWKPVLFGNQKGNHGREGRKGTTGIGMCVSALTPNCQLLSSLSLSDSFSQRVSERKRHSSISNKRRILR